VYRAIVAMHHRDLSADIQCFIGSHTKEDIRTCFWWSLSCNQAWIEAMAIMPPTVAANNASAYLQHSASGRVHRCGKSTARCQR